MVYWWSVKKKIYVISDIDNILSTLAEFSVRTQVKTRVIESDLLRVFLQVNTFIA